MGGDVLSLGVMGTADIAVSRVIKSLQGSKKVKVHAISSREISGAEKWAVKLGIENYFGSYEEMLKSRDIDAVYIPLPNAMHCEWAIRALNARKHVLCEKPLATTVADAEEIIKVCKEE